MPPNLFLKNTSLMPFAITENKFQTAIKKGGTK
jgi:hypothetical protein